MSIQSTVLIISNSKHVRTSLIKHISTFIPECECIEAKNLELAQNYCSTTSFNLLVIDYASLIDEILSNITKLHVVCRAKIILLTERETPSRKIIETLDPFKILPRTMYMLTPNSQSNPLILTIKDTLDKR